VRIERAALGLSRMNGPWRVACLQSWSIAAAPGRLPPGSGNALVLNAFGFSARVLSPDDVVESQMGFRHKTTGSATGG
jgi:hypothetical protein